ncbi:antitoxin [Streptomyces sp. XM4193]|uniref:antitoxin n=1 Tax=Streptomyces sp. XM4193 TaxID=2929782 RepID=UPI001FF9470B|nr:antitoxin [Streptomyces sp. XM4193]MCK1798748.1 antitoxin [Streptomyces sp. XM4193]
MGFMEKIKGLLGQHSDKVGQGLDKAGQAVDSKTGGKYSKHIKTGTDKAKEALGDNGKGDGGRGGRDDDGNKGR